MTTRTQWQMRGTGYEFCNCDFGCGCNFGGFPNSKDGSCHALVGMHIAAGVCGDVIARRRQVRRARQMAEGDS